MGGIVLRMGTGRVEKLTDECRVISLQAFRRGVLLFSFWVLGVLNYGLELRSRSGFSSFSSDGCSAMA